MDDLLRTIDDYLDAVPRPASDVEPVGPFNLFVARPRGWRYYARPAPGAGQITVEEVERVRARQRELGQPEAFEWVVDLVPSLGPAAAATGLHTLEHPLMVLDRDRFTAQPAREGIAIRFLDAEEDLRAAQAVPMIAFSNPGTTPGAAGEHEVRAEIEGVSPEMAQFLSGRIRDGLTQVAVAYAGDVPVAVGSLQPVGAVAEIAGVGVLPAFRRRGIGSAITSILAEEAAPRGVDTVFLSASDEVIARVYERLGFRTIGRAGAAEPMEAS